MPPVAPLTQLQKLVLLILVSLVAGFFVGQLLNGAYRRAIILAASLVFGLVFGKLLRLYRDRLRDSNL